jgi:serine/threonine protein phosphatase PrpC
MRALGSHDYVQVDTRMLRYQAGDVFLLCSDGLHGYLRGGEVETLVGTDLAGSAERLVQLALDRGGKDNITAVLVRAEGE